jgi:tRNA dimethylallyltransferase
MAEPAVMQPTTTQPGAPAPVVALTGPTACGKSGLAVRVAERFGGEIVNADSMQVYRDLSILTARPDAAATARVPHHLYGVLPAGEPCSAARWRALAEAAIAQVHARGRLPILVGGTGLYLRALLQGLVQVPGIPAGVRESVRDRQGRLPPADLHAQLAARDPAMAARLHATDTQRVARALEVVEATGRSLADYQAQPDAPPLAHPVHVIAALPRRGELYRRIESRLVQMVAQGALAELRDLLDQDLDPALPAMKAVGVPQLARYLRGAAPYAEALAAAQAATRRYAKRQITWLRHQTVRDAASATFIGAQFSKSLSPVIFNDIRAFLLTAQRSDTSFRNPGV